MAGFGGDLLQAAQVLVEDGEQQFLLAAEVAVDRARGDPYRGGDVRHAHLVVADCPESLGGGSQDLLPAIPGALRAGTRFGVCRHACRRHDLPPLRGGRVTGARLEGARSAVRPLQRCRAAIRRSATGAVSALRGGRSRVSVATPSRTF